MDDVNSLVTA